MSERITIDQLNERARGVNRRLAGTGRGVVVEQRNGQVGLDEYRVDYTLGGGGRFDDCIRTITVGTKREIADFLHAMMVGIDLSGGLMFTVENHGSIVLVRPLTSDVEVWLREHTGPEAQWFGTALACEPRYVEPIVEGLIDDGFCEQ